MGVRAIVRPLASRVASLRRADEAAHRDDEEQGSGAIATAYSAIRAAAAGGIFRSICGRVVDGDG